MIALWVQCGNRAKEVGAKPKEGARSCELSAGCGLDIAGPHPARAALWGVEGLTGSGLGPLLPPVFPAKSCFQSKGSWFPLDRQLGAKGPEQTWVTITPCPFSSTLLPRPVLVPCPAFSLAFPAPPPSSILPLLLFSLLLID